MILCMYTFGVHDHTAGAALRVHKSSVCDPADDDVVAKPHHAAPNCVYIHVRICIYLSVLVSVCHGGFILLLRYMLLRVLILLA